MIVRGEDHKTGTEADTEQRFSALHDRTRARLPVSAPVFSWSAQVEEPIDGLPYIGRNSASENVYVATGFSGNGITFGTLAAQIVTDLVMKRENLYAATRIKAGGAVATYLAENVDFPMHFVSDHVRPAEVGSLDEIAPVAPGRGACRLERVHAPRLRREVQSFREELGLPVSRLALRRRRPRRRGRASSS